MRERKEGERGENERKGEREILDCQTTAQVYLPYIHKLGCLHSNC